MCGLEVKMSEWVQDMSKIVLKLRERRDSEPFRQPVDWEELGLTDYLTVVSQPRDLGTIQKNLKRMTYQRRELCVQDIRLVWKNAMMYNNVSQIR